MAVSYQSYQPGRGGGNMKAHCNAIARSYECVATELVPPDIVGEHH